MLFDDAQGRARAPSDAWMARVTADAVRELRLQQPVLRPSLWQQISSALGGWQGMGGLAAACAVGLWLGFAPPVVLGDPVATALGGAQTLEVLDGAAFDYAALLEEG